MPAAKPALKPAAKPAAKACPAFFGGPRYGFPSAKLVFFFLCGLTMIYGRYDYN